MNIFAVLATVNLLALCVNPAVAAPSIGAGKSCFEYQDACYSTAAEACQAVAKERRADRSVENPYGRVAGAKDTGDGFWCKLVDKDGNDTEQNYGIKRSTQANRPPEDAPPGTPEECDLDKQKGAALKRAVISRLQRYADESNRALIDQPKEMAESVPGIGKGFFTGDYGTLLENLVAQRLSTDTCLSKFIVHLSAGEQSRGTAGEKASHPDFKGVGNALNALQIDITTEEEKARKLATDGGKSDYVFIIYERGLCLDPKSKLAMKIPVGADRTKIKNGSCPRSWK